MKCKSCLLAALCLVLSCTIVDAQLIEDRSRSTISLSAFSETLGIPKHSALHYLNNSIDINNYGGAISYGYSSSASLLSFAHEIVLGYYRHVNLHQAVFIGWKPSLEFKILNSFGAHAILGFSYAHTFATEQTYVLDGEVYAPNQDKGHSHFMPSIGGGVSLDFYRLIQVPIEIFVRHELFGFAPYSTDGDFPLTINHKLSLGIKISID